MKFQYSKMLQRLPEQFFANLVHKINLLEKDGHDIIKLAQGNPDGKTPDHIVKELQIASEKTNYHGYSPSYIMFRLFFRAQIIVLI
ncbi:hypothetical protein [Tepidibacillus marianensis]|uniref:hypothetical protein n=1 Tax=Tepidibacillus marianensis TaxID=3131995 RepID=UPI0030D5218A